MRTVMKRTLLIFTDHFLLKQKNKPEAETEPEPSQDISWGNPLPNYEAIPKVPDFSFWLKRTENATPPPNEETEYESPSVIPVNYPVSDYEDIQESPETQQTKLKKKKASKKKSMTIAEFLGRKTDHGTTSKA